MDSGGPQLAGKRLDEMESVQPGEKLRGEEGVYRC